MGLIIYKDHVITADVFRHETIDKYDSNVRIVWQNPDGTRGMHSYTMDKRFATIEQATAAAFVEGKAWVDQRLPEDESAETSAKPGSPVGQT